MPEKPYCRWHSPDPADVAKHLADSQRGGDRKAWGNMVELPPLADEEDVAQLDLATAAGVRDYLAASLRALARLPFSVRVATAIAQLASTQRQGIEAGDLERRLDALEHEKWPRRLRSV